MNGNNSAFGSNRKGSGLEDWCSIFDPHFDNPTELNKIDKRISL